MQLTELFFAAELLVGFHPCLYWTGFHYFASWFMFAL